MGDPVTPGLRGGVVFCAYGMIMIGLVCNLIAMKFYPLTKEKMEEIQDEVAQIKMKAMLRTPNWYLQFSAETCKIK